MTITFPSKACALICTWKNYLLLKRQFTSQTWMKGICQDTTSILGSSAGYPEKRSHNRMIDSHNKAYSPKIGLHLTPLVKVDFQSSVLYHFTFFNTGLLMWRKKHQPHETRSLNKVVTLCTTEEEVSGLTPQIHNQYLQSQALVSTWSHFSIHCIRSPGRSSKPPPMLLIWRWICFYPTRSENTDENQPIINLKPPTFANTTVTSKKARVFTRTLLFCSDFYDVSWMIEQPNLSIFLSVADFANQGLREMSVGLQLQPKDQNHTAINHCCLTHSQVGAKGAFIPPFLDCKYSNVKQKLLWSRKINYSIHQAADS